MKILFDQGTPAPLRRALAEHEVDTAFEKGWDQLKKGELLAIAILNGYEVLISTDQSLRHQHDLRRIRLGIVILMTTSWPRINRNTSSVARAVQDAQVGRGGERGKPWPRVYESEGQRWAGATSFERWSSNGLDTRMNVCTHCASLFVRADETPQYPPRDGFDR